MKKWSTKNNKNYLLGINYLSKKDDWKKTEKNNVTIDVFYTKNVKNIFC